MLTFPSTCPGEEGQMLLGCSTRFCDDQKGFFVSDSPQTAHERRRHCEKSLRRKALPFSSAWVHRPKMLHGRFCGVSESFSLASAPSRARIQEHEKICYKEAARIGEERVFRQGFLALGYATDSLSSAFSSASYGLSRHGPMHFVLGAMGRIVSISYPRVAS